MAQGDTAEQAERSGAGLTMVEMVISLAIISIMASVAVWAFRNVIDQSRLQEAADRMVADLRLVREQARREQRDYTVQLQPGGRSYDAEGVVRPGEVSDISVCLADSPYRISVMNFQRTDAEAGSDITFDARGRSDAAGYIVLGEGGKQVRIRITVEGGIEQVD